MKIEYDREAGTFGEGVGEKGGEGEFENQSAMEQDGKLRVGVIYFVRHTGLGSDIFRQSLETMYRMTSLLFSGLRPVIKIE